MAHWQYWLAIGLVIWAVCGFLAYGMDLAHFQKKWPSLADEDRDRDRRRALFTALCGPLGLVASLIHCRHGFMWRLPPRKEG